MKIHKALKVKNRLIGEITRLRTLVKRENSRRNDNTSQVDVPKLLVELENTEKEFINIKTALTIASAPIARKLVELAYLKDQIKFLNGIPTKDGEELDSIGGSMTTVTYQWKSTINREKLDSMLVEVQNKINSLQDEIDEFNASTNI